MFETNEQIKESAVLWAKKNKSTIAKKITDKTIYPPDTHPAAIFMAGCPAAGKSEFARAFAKLIGSSANQSGEPIMIIDPDEIREMMPGYNGINSSLFQHPASIIVDKAFDLVMKNNQSFILDGTLSDAKKALQNVKRCLKRNYLVRIIFVYNSPLKAWEVANAREKKDGRAIDIDVFIDRYFKSKESIRILKKEFGQNILIDLLFKDLNEKNVRPEFNIECIDSYLPEKYTPASLRKAITEKETNDANAKN
ncbi:MAG: zeta toxin family protein [Pseudomonadales bacterium]|nr:zeta toxin family protein [Pseudomonadales bacterium]